MEEEKSLADEIKCIFSEISAKNGEGISEMFNKISATIMESEPQSQQDGTNSL